MRLLFSLVLLALSTASLATDQIVIISPHRKSIQQEFIPAFKEHYKKTFKTDIKVDWLDQGGTSDDVRYIRARFKANKESAGIDIFWGGGNAAYIDLHAESLLSPMVLPKSLRAELPRDASGIPMTNDQETWHSSAMSSFGIFYNKLILKMDGLKQPKTWSDLSTPELFGNISLADPRRSGSANTMNNIILQSLGFEEGYALLTMIGGNTRSYTHSSSDPIKAVVSGDAAVALAIDFYANAKIQDLGEKNLGLVLPQHQTVLDPDPVAILKGAPNRKAAERFVHFVLSSDAQKFLMLPKGSKGGPKLSTIGRFSVNTKTYQETEGKRLSMENPFIKNDFFKYDAAKSSKLQRVLNDLIGATIIDSHGPLKKAWKHILKGGVDKAELKAIGKAPVTEKELMELAEKWDDNVLRNKVINQWVDFAARKYKQAISN